MSKRIFLDIHAIQTLPPSNMNRDDTGSPKTAQYGGVQRARVSSQAWKRAMRGYFANESGTAIGIRTKDIVSYVRDRITEKHPELGSEDAFEMARKTINAAGVSTDKDGRAKALFFLGKKQAEALGEAAVNGVKDKKQLQTILRQSPEVDIALFGRMVADDPSLNEDASAQVAHAISTHAVQTEFDFYAAVDDLSPEDSQGAGMLGTVEYNSSTLYRYANVAVHELLRQLGSVELTANTVRLFTEAFVKSLPTGKVNTFANQTLPQTVMVNIRDDRPVNLVSAFEEPVKPSHGFVQPSEERLFAELKRAQKFVNKPLYTLYITDITPECDGVSEESLRELLDDLAVDIASLAADNQN